MAGRAFPLGRGPHSELRVTTGAGTNTVHLITDLTIIDGRSIHFLVRELFRLYADPTATPRPSPAADGESAGHADYLAERAALDTAERRVEQLTHWQARVAALSPGPLPPPPPGPAPRVRHEERLTGFDALRRAARAAGLQPDDLLAAAFTEVLAQHFTPPFSLPVVRWTPQTARYRPGEYTALSWITRTDAHLPPWEQAAAFRSVLDVDAGMDGMSGLTELRRRVMRERRTGHFELPVVYTGILDLTDQPLPSGVRLGSWLTCTPDVSLDCVTLVEGDELRLYWDAAPTHFPPGVLPTMFAAYRDRVRALCTEAAQRLSAAAGPEPLSATDRRRILYDWNATDHPYPVDGPVHLLFEEQVRQRPDAVAVRWSGGTMTYGELDRRATAVAAALRRLGVGPETGVGVSVPRGPHLAVAVFGVLKAGGFYVPLEPSLPAERAAAIIDDAQLSLVLTSTDRTGWTVPAELRAVAVDEPAVLTASDASDVPGRRPIAGIDTTAYVIFTSGSTGRPKGVAVTHRPLRNLLNWCYRTHGFGPDDIGLCVTSLGFDLSVFDLFGLLGCGASLYIADAVQQKDPALLLDVLLDEQITFWNSAPTTLNQIAPLFAARADSPGRDKLRLVYLSGDYTPLPLPDEIRSMFPNARVVSLGGATEATVWSNWFEIGAIDPEWRSIPYGKPIDNARYYILDDLLRPCPVGVEGDLFIGGDCLSSGYHRQPTLTAWQFIPDPFGDRPGARLYRTGDRACYFPDGNICFLGRADGQVKIRGFRVELGEIEHRLRSYPGVKDAVVLARPDHTGDRKLVAYVVPSADPPPTVRDLRHHAGTALPDYMVPNVVVFVDGFPATGNGKLDRDALPWPVEPGSRHTLLPSATPVSRRAVDRTGESAAEEPELAGPAAATALAAELVAIFVDLLDVTSVDPDADIWDQGATSYTMVQVSAALQQRYGRRVPVSVLLSDPTITGIAHAVLGEARPAPAAPAAEPEPRTIDLFAAEERAAFKQARPDLRPAEPDTRVLALPDHRMHPAHLRWRATHREFAPGPVPAADFARLLSMLREVELDGRSRRLYPSAGDTYAVQVYLHVRPGGVDGVPGGLYYYHPVEHELHLIDADPQLDRSIHFVYNRPIFDQAGFGLYLFGQADAIEPLYADDAERFMLLEAGYLGQTLLLGQAACGVGLCPIGNVEIGTLRTRLGLSERHRYLQAFLGGAAVRAEPDLAEGTRPFTPYQIAPAEGVPAIRAADGVSATAPAAEKVEVVVTGMAARLPGAADLDGFWTLLADGGTALAPPPPQRVGQVVDEVTEPAERRYPVSGGYLDEVDTFDSLLFHIAPRDAAALDPQSRLLLHTVWECLESAGHSPASLRNGTRRVGVFLGAMWQDHRLAGVERWRGGDTATISATASDMANRISHFFGFDGPSIAVDTSCSSSLAALHLAADSLRQGECDAAIVAAANLITHPYHLALLTDLGLLATATPDGAFDGSAPGWPPGEGVAAVLLRPRRAAERDGDNLLAVVEASRIGHAGGTGRFGVPDADALRRSITATLTEAGLTPSSVNYVECAAAGATLADAAELEALNTVFRSAPEPVAIGTVKPVIGHLEAAAGLSQLLKVLLQLRHDRLVPTRMASRPAPLITFEAVRPVDRLTPWAATVDGPRRALITAVGATGSYGHVLVRSVDAPTVPSPGDGATGRTEVVVLSAESGAQLRAMSARLHKALTRATAMGDAPRLVDIAYTTQTGRVPLSHRLAVRCTDVAELGRALHAHANGTGHPALTTGVADPGLADVPDPADEAVAAVPGWLAGRAVDWSGFWQPGQARRVVLPGYPFAAERYRLTPPPRRSAVAQPVDTVPVEQPVDGGAADAERRALAYLREIFAEASGIPPQRLHPRVPLDNYGLTSYLVSTLNERMIRDLGEVPRTLFFAHPDLAGVAAELAARCAVFHSSGDRGEPADAEATEPNVAATEPGHHIAVIGIAGRYPQAPDLDTFWRNLRAGRDCIGPLPPERHRPDWPVERMVGGFLAGVDLFDPIFFGITPRDAALLDPQERLFLEVAWHTLEDAGYPRTRLRERHHGRVGVFVGSMYNEYPYFGLDQAVDDVDARRNGRWQPAGSAIAGIANRVSYLLDLRGPSLTVDTMCSSSLTALHLAVASLRRGECAAALVGGVNLSLHPNKFVQLAALGMASSDHRCRSFGAGGDGFVPGEGVGAILLKPLDAAIADGDRIHAVIRGTAINHGGRTNGYTVPNPIGQGDLVRQALADAGLDGDEISYVEAHGTGTALGDPVEIDGLQRALGGPRRTGVCAIGSVKSNIGHAEAAAGIAGLTKVILQMRHRTLVPSLHAEQLNPNIDWDGSFLRVQRNSAPWTPDADGRLRAGVSSFGAGGSGAHVVVESYQPTATVSDEPTGPQLVVLSARTADRLTAVARGLRDHLADPAVQLGLADLAYTLQVGREPLRERLALVVADRAELCRQLTRFVDGDPAVGIRGRAAAPADPDTLAKAVDGRDPADLAELGRHWVTGGRIDWAALHDSRRHIVGLPGYPFDRVRCWVTERPASPARPDGDGPATGQPASAEPSTLPAAVRLLTRRWVAAESDHPAAGPAAGGTVLMLFRPDQRALVDAVTERLHPARVVPLCQTRHAVPAGTAVLPDEAAAFAVAEAVSAEHGPITGWLDLCALPGEEPADERAEHDHGPWAARLAVLQRLVARRPAPGLRVMQVTRGLLELAGPAPDLTGARLAGFVRALPAEYPWVQADVVDLDGDPRRTVEAADRIARAWWRVAPQGQVCLRGDVAYLPTLAPVTVAAQWTPHPDRTYLITGGTGGLGALVAAHLVRRGARQIAIVGHRPLPPRHEWHRADQDPRQARVIAGLTALERDGARVMVHTGDLADRIGLDRFLRQVRSSLGELGGVVHCAGRSTTGRPALVHKSLTDFRTVLAPKGDGLDTLAELTVDDPLEFFVLFGSVSAAVAALAAGVTDYAAANAYLAHAATHHARLGRTEFRVVEWPVWRETGGAVDRPDAAASVGLDALTDEVGLAVLDRALAPDAPVSLLPCLALPNLDPAKLLVANRPVEPSVGTTDGDRGTGGSGTDGTGGSGSTDSAAGPEPWLVDLFAETLAIPAEQLDPDVEFGDLGVESVMLGELLTRIEHRIGRPLEPATLLEHATLDRLAGHLREIGAVAVTSASVPADYAGGAAAAPQTAAQQPVTGPPADRIAVIGMACRFPGAPDLDAFWHLLRTGECAVSDVPPGRWDVDRIYRGDGGPGSSISRWGGFVSGIEDFDPDFFEMSEHEAKNLDPAVRLVMEAAASCLRDAGYRDDELRGRDVGVFVGARMSGYRRRIRTADAATGLGGDQNFIAARLAHQYDLRGPNLVVDSACSSALVSVQLACRALLAGDAEIAFAGGVEVLLDEEPYLEFTAARALSPRGRCATFAQDADGFVPGEGVGLLLLKPLTRAIADGDRIHAVIDAVAVGNDGHTMGLTTPNPVAQGQVVRRALAQAGVRADDLGMIEAHGTATMLGDPIELRALTDVFREQTGRTGFCAIGSVKSNIGHLLSAAGVAGLIKILLALEHGEIPPTLFCERPNPRFEFDSSPFYPNRALRPWPGGGGRRIAGVSAFGLGGTNAHLIASSVDQAIAATRRTPLPPPVFRRRRLWWERPAHPAQPTDQLVASVLDLSFVTPGDR
ncbi:MAG TPA: amino acid adenylation domain-containing protein [Micromonosporaceae bacterium]